MIEFLLALHAAATLLMSGLAWFVAVVHYPLMAEVGGQEFPRYERLHRQRTTWLVAPLMMAEAGLAAWLSVFPPPAVPLWQPHAASALLAAIWVSTFAVQVPLHERLSLGFDAAVHRRLVVTHFWRTAAWTLRSVFALAWLAMQGMAPAPLA